MAYDIRKSDGTLLLSLGDGLIDKASSSLTFVGRNVTKFGEIQNENFLFLLENFAALTEPANKITGQTWWDLTSNSLKIYNQDRWQPIAILSTSTSTANVTGNLWLDLPNKQVYVNTGSGFSLVGPEGIPGYETTRVMSDTILDTGDTYQPVIKVIVNGEIVSVISTSTFNVNPSNAISGISTVFRGITTKNYSTNDFTLVGRSALSNMATTATNISSGAAGSVPYQTTAGQTSFVSIGAADRIFYSNGSVPCWLAASSITVGCATASGNLVCGATGSIPYQFSAGSTVFLPIGLNGSLLQSNGVCPTYVSTSNVYVGQSFNAINLNGGSSGALLYQTAGSTTGFVSIGSAGTFLSSNGSVPTYVSTASMYVNRAVGADCAICAGSANNSTCLNGQAASFYQSLSCAINTGNIASQSVNNSTCLNGQAASFYQAVSCAINTGNIASQSVCCAVLAGTANNSTCLNGQAASFYQAVSCAINTGNIAAQSVCNSCNTMRIRNGGNTMYLTASTGADAYTIAERDNNADIFANVFHGTATSARYADLAEKYLPDENYDVGTVVKVGGEKEITKSTLGCKVIGVISGNPAHLMNAELEDGIAVALKGRVPVKVLGTILKGDCLIPAEDGCAMFSYPDDPRIFAISLEDNTDGGVKLVEAVIL